MPASNRSTEGWPPPGWRHDTHGCLIPVAAAFLNDKEFLVSVPSHRYNGARSLVLLHEKHLRAFVDTWKQAKALSLSLPPTRDPNVASLDAMLHHVLRAARGYMVWTCDKLDLPDPRIEATPAVDAVAAQVETYLDHLVQRWATPLAQVDADRFEKPEYESRWGTRYCIDAMLEHAVMHPIRHAFQLQNLMDGNHSGSGGAGDDT
jgi:hypothetical protein